jgi:hypothetical protein
MVSLFPFLLTWVTFTFNFKILMLSVNFKVPLRWLRPGTLIRIHESPYKNRFESYNDSWCKNLPVRPYFAFKLQIYANSGI